MEQLVVAGLALECTMSAADPTVRGYPLPRSSLVTPPALPASITGLPMDSPCVRIEPP